MRTAVGPHHGEMWSRNLKENKTNLKYPTSCERFFIIPSSQQSWYSSKAVVTANIKRYPPTPPPILQAVTSTSNRRGPATPSLWESSCHIWKGNSWLSSYRDLCQLHQLSAAWSLQNLLSDWSKLRRRTVSPRLTFRLPSRAGQTENFYSTNLTGFTQYKTIVEYRSLQFLKFATHAVKILIEKSD